MAKKNKKTHSSRPASRKTPRFSLKKGILVGILFLVMLSFILTSIPKFGSSPTPAPASSATTTAPVNTANASSTTFTKQGTLSFIRSNNPDPLTIDIEVADTETKRNQGLMYRRQMAQNHGMLFIMEEMKIQSFYMRNTHVSLDIIYVDDQKKIVSIQKNTTPLSEKSLPSTGDALYVVEVNAGYTDTYNIQEGDTIAFELD